MHMCVQDVAYGALASASEGTRFKSDPGPAPTLQSVSVVLPEGSDAGMTHHHFLYTLETCCISISTPSDCSGCSFEVLVDPDLGVHDFVGSACFSLHKAASF